MELFKKGSKLLFCRHKSKILPKAIIGKAWNFETIRLQNVNIYKHVSADYVFSLAKTL